MNEQSLIYAFALNNENTFHNSHFGEAPKYGIYKFIEGEFQWEKELPNQAKDIEESSEQHGSKKKGNLLINFLKDSGVNVLVSSHFGPNIKMVIHHFIPVIVLNNNTEEVISVLTKHNDWFHDELANNPSEYKLFKIKNNGIQKKAIS